MAISDRNSRTGNEERETRAGSKISRPEREKAGNGKKIAIINVHPKMPYLRILYFVLPHYCKDMNIPKKDTTNLDRLK